MSICLCQGKYEGCDHGSTCSERAGGEWSPHFCWKCDKHRTAHIDRVFSSLNPIKRIGK